MVYIIDIIGMDVFISLFRTSLPHSLSLPTISHSFPISDANHDNNGLFTKLCQSKPLCGVAKGGPGRVLTLQKSMLFYQLSYLTWSTFVYTSMQIT